MKIGDWVLYKETEVGRVASFNRYGEPFVCYHLGETAALTPKEYLRNISEKEAKDKVCFGYELEDIGGGRFD